MDYTIYGDRLNEVEIAFAKNKLVGREHEIQDMLKFMDYTEKKFDSDNYQDMYMDWQRCHEKYANLFRPLHLDLVIDEAVKQPAAKQYLEGNVKAINQLVGFCMKANKSFSPELAKKKIEERLSIA